MVRPSTPADVPGAEASSNLGIVAGPLPAGIILLAPMLLLGYSLTKTKHEAILADLGRGTPRSR
jgi:Na+/melibiose symporter-like transporter